MLMVPIYYQYLIWYGINSNSGSSNQQPEVHLHPSVYVGSISAQNGQGGTSPGLLIYLSIHFLLPPPSSFSVA